MERLRFIDQVDIAHSYLVDEMGAGGPMVDPREMRAMTRTWLRTGKFPEPESPTPIGGKAHTVESIDGRQVVRLEGSRQPKTIPVGHGIKVSEEDMAMFRAMGGDMKLKLPAGRKLPSPDHMKQRKPKAPGSKPQRRPSPPVL